MVVNPDKIEPETFDSGSRAYRKKLWVTLDSKDGEFRHLFWRRICLVVAAVSAAGWIVLTAGAWAEVRYYRGVSNIRYVDMALPWRWGQYRADLGLHDLTLGRLEMDALHPDLALIYFRAAEALEPGSLEARRMAARAEFLLGFKADALARLRMKVDAAAVAGDQAYLFDYFKVAFDLQADDEAFATSLQLLPRQPISSRTHQLIALAMATARYNRGYYRESEQILGDWGLQDLPEGDILLAQCEFEQGLRSQAISRLDADLARYTNREPILVALERLFLDQGRRQAVRQYAFLREIDQPANAQARMDLICADQAVGRKADETAEINGYFALYRTDAGAMALLAQFAANTGDPVTAARAREMARRAGIPLAEFDLCVAQANLVAQDYRSALRAVSIAQGEGGFEGRAGRAVLSGIRVVALLADGDSGAELAFSRFLANSGELRPVTGLFLVRKLKQAGFARQSRQLLERICSGQPGDEPALAELVRSDAILHNRAGLSEHLPSLLKMRKPPRDALESSLPWLDPAKDAPLRFQLLGALSDSRALGG
jgi:hypothetical protein